MSRHRDTTRNRTLYRVTATWPAPAPTVQFENEDRRHVYAKARKWAQTGAVVNVERAKGFEWQHERTLDGPALVAEQEQARAEAAEAARRQAVEEQLDQQTAAFVARVLAEHAEAEHDRHARLMQSPPVPRRAEGRTTAAHVVARRGIR
ncbi:hypothetical protein Q3V23_19065 [Streptomyces sp. VNUA116]|uniref:hypothetical protein n=1 Tax=Streptomyces sp. VNUA116 TaxID=3062449 RepID=UPI0026751B00|nr:hypothetical protein [Streptomyces sp. VNUA116]WKU45991.1 hypothetical protein Q3V23_19065 [Streptomyces sp. VNUA116]